MGLFNSIVKRLYKFLIVLGVMLIFGLGLMEYRDYKYSKPDTLVYEDGKKTVFNTPDSWCGIDDSLFGVLQTIIGKTYYSDEVYILRDQCSYKSISIKAGQKKYQTKDLVHIRVFTKNKFDSSEYSKLFSVCTAENKLGFKIQELENGTKICVVPPTKGFNKASDLNLTTITAITTQDDHYVITSTVAEENNVGNVLQTLKQLVTSYQLNR